MKRTDFHSKSYQRQYRDVLPPNTRYAIPNDFRTPKGDFNCRYKKYYYWCRGNQRWMHWYTFPYDDLEDMQNQIDCLKKQINNKQILVDV